MRTKGSEETDETMGLLESPASSLRRRPNALASPSSQIRPRMVFETPPLRRDTSQGTIFAMNPNAPNTPSSAKNLQRLSEASDLLPLSSADLQRVSLSKLTWRQLGHEAMTSLPSIVIAIVLNLMICVPFGLSFVPAEWKEMPVPRALGIQMFLLTTAICQFVFVGAIVFKWTKSSFVCSLSLSDSLLA